MTATETATDADENLTIQEAADYLGCSVRTLQRAPLNELMPSKRRDDKTGQVVNTYSRAQLTAYKSRRENPSNIRSQVLPVREAARDGLALSGEDEDRQQRMASLALQSLLLRVADVAAESAMKAVQAHPEGLRQPATEALSLPGVTAKSAVHGAVPVADKVMLTVEEARQLSGLSRDFIRNAINSGELKAQRIGRAQRIKRSDFDAWIVGL